MKDVQIKKEEGEEEGGKSEEEDDGEYDWKKNVLNDEDYDEDEEFFDDYEEA
jgi:hypothetical protein